MNYGIKQPPLFPALAVSLVLHGAAMALWGKPIHPNSPVAAVSTLTVTLTSLPSQRIDNGQKQLSIPDKQNVSARPAPRKRGPDEPVTPGQPQGPTAQARQPPAIKKIKAAPRSQVKKHGGLPNGMAGQYTGTLKKLSAPDSVGSFAAKSTAQPDGQGLTEAKVKYNDGHAPGNQQIFPVAQPAIPKLTNKLPATSALLPPLLASRQPEYPEEARWEERTGKVTVKFRISGQGHVIEPNISDSSGHRDLDLAALQAIHSWRFDAKEGQAYNHWYHYSFRFELN